MDPTKIIRFSVRTTALLVFCACTTRGPVRPTSTHDNKSAPPAITALPAAEVAKDLLPPAPPPSQDLPPASPENPAPNPPPPPRTFGVWIDGAGLEAMAALGFLQELEHRGFKPVKVVGTGFGCWVAMSWALENSGNRAEWQSYKWSNWDALPRSGLLGKLTSGRARRKFEDEVERLFPVKKFDNLSLAADCPLVPKRRPVTLVSGRSWSLASNLWYQLQVPALGVEKNQEEFYSGMGAGMPTARELDLFSRDVPKEKNFAGWFIVRTRTSRERSGSDSWAEILAARGDEAMPTAGRSADGISWLAIDLSEGEGRQIDDVQKFEKRREWLLQGRRVGADLVQKSEGRGFFD